MAVSATVFHGEDLDCQGYEDGGDMPFDIVQVDGGSLQTTLEH